MKRTLATLGVVGLGLISLTAPAMAASDQVVVCHWDGTQLTQMGFNVNGIGGHIQHDEDIIPPTPNLPAGKNWTTAGKTRYVNECGAALPPGEVIDPVDPPVVVDPPVTTPVVTPPAEEPVVVDAPVTTPVQTPETTASVPETQVVAAPVQSPAAVAPAAAAPVQQAPVKQVAAAPKAAPAPVSVGTNQGYNAQTAVGAPDGGTGLLAGLGAMAAAAAAVAVRRRARPQH